MRVINKSRLEMYVENYLKSKPPRTAQGLNYLRKAKAYIEYAIIYRSCDFTEPVLNLYTLSENQFTKTVYYMMRTIDLNYYRSSLQRTLQMLEKYINQ
jgi:transposase-like protein